jgi:hypothetical protein
MTTTSKVLIVALLAGLCVLSGCGGAPIVTDNREIVTTDEIWDNPGMIRDHLAAIGAAVHLGNEAAARDSAAANGRAQLAATLKAEINQLIEDWSKQAGNLQIKQSLSSYINNENFTRQFVDTTIRGARAVKYARRGDTQYCLVILDVEKTKEWYDQMSDALEQEALRDATLWKTEAMKSEARDRFEKIKKEREEAHLNKIQQLMGGGK